jgi:hypothetical protein
MEKTHHSGMHVGFRGQLQEIWHLIYIRELGSMEDLLALNFTMTIGSEISGALTSHTSGRICHAIYSLVISHPF